MTDLVLLQAMRLKGRLTADGAAACAGISLDRAQSALAVVEQAGWAQPAGAALRLTPSGRDRLDVLLSAESRHLDVPRMHAHYETFNDLNSELKSLITAWQMKDEQTPNDHSDAEHDQRIVDRLVELHDRFDALLADIVADVPRLSPYRARFAHAVTRIQAGDRSFIARPIADSYHTVWFELHEELLAVLGLNRIDEASAGRAL